MNLAAAPAADMTRRRTLPADAHWEVWRAADGARLRTVHWRGQPGRAAILFLNGRADFIEKYAETYWRWVERGYAVMTFDWRGQGLSDRTTPERGVFDALLGDLAGIVAHAARTLEAPLVLSGHSMGGHLALRHLARAGPASPVRRAALFSPMAGIRAAGMPPAAFGFVAGAVVALGGGGGYAPSQGPYGPRQRRPARQRLLTGDAGRFGDESWWIETTPALALGGANWRWIAEANASCRALAAPGVPESIGVPVEVFMGSLERLIDPAAAAAITRRLPHGRWHTVDGAAHELLRERPQLQERLHAELDAVLGAAA